jgi:hypothetical protein
MVYKKGTVVNHPKADWGHGIVIEDSNGQTVKIGFEKVGIKTISLEYVKPNIIDVPSVADYEVQHIAERHRVYCREPILDIHQDIKSRYPEHLVIIENGCYFDLIAQDAEYMSNIFGYEIYRRQDGAEGAGFPTNAIEVWTDLRNLRKSYIVVSQLPERVGGNVQRSISEVFP